MKSLRELEECWSLDELLDANMALDLWDEIEAKAHAAARAKET